MNTLKDSKISHLTKETRRGKKTLSKNLKDAYFGKFFDFIAFFHFNMKFSNIANS